MLSFMTIAGRARATLASQFTSARVVSRRLERLLALRRRGRDRVGAAAVPAGKFDFEGWDAVSRRRRLLAVLVARVRSTRATSASSKSPGRIATTENYSFNPLVVGSTMYVLAKGRSIVALDAATGREIWTHANEGGVGARGMNYWRSPDGSEERLLYVNAGHLTAIDAKTGETIRVVRRRRPRRLARRPRRRHLDDPRAADAATRAGFSRT